MITRRDFVVATVAIAVTGAAVVAYAQSVAKPVMHSAVFNWSDLKAESKPSGERREVFDSATTNLDRLECHVTTLNPGETPHPAHQHPEEEVVIVTEGTLEVMQNGLTNRVETGGVIFCAANERHGWRNIGTNRASYYIVKIVPHGLNTNRIPVIVPAK